MRHSWQQWLIINIVDLPRCLGEMLLQGYVVLQGGDKPASSEAFDHCVQPCSFLSSRSLNLPFSSA